MAETNTDQNEQKRKQRRKQRIVASALVVIGLAHAFAPHRFAVDWPSVALICLGALIIFVPLNQVGDIVKSFKIGDTEVVLRSVKELDQSVKAAVVEEGQKPLELHAAAETSASTIPLVDEKIQALLSTDKEMALLRISLEVQRLLTKLYEAAGGRLPRTGIVWRTATEFLVEKGVIQPATANACLGFRNVRNELIHSTGTPLSDSLIASAVDSGVSLITLLSSIA